MARGYRNKSKNDGHRQIMLVAGALGAMGTMAFCGASWGVGCILGYAGSARMFGEGATGKDYLAEMAKEGALLAGQTPENAATSADVATLMFDIAMLTTGVMGIGKVGLKMVNVPGSIQSIPQTVTPMGISVSGMAPLAHDASLLGVGAIDIVHDAMLMSGETK